MYAENAMRLLVLLLTISAAEGLKGEVLGRENATLATLLDKLV